MYSNVVDFQVYFIFLMYDKKNCAFLTFSLCHVSPCNFNCFYFIILTETFHLSHVFFNYRDSQTVGLICFNLLHVIDFDPFCKRAECDAPKTSISCHNIYLVIYSILFDVFLM